MGPVDGFRLLFFRFKSWDGLNLFSSPSLLLLIQSPTCQGRSRQLSYKSNQDFKTQESHFRTAGTVVYTKTSEISYLRHDATHLAWLEVAEENSHPVLHLVFRYKLDQARDDCAWLFFSNINLSKYFKISLITANHNRKTFPVWLRNRLRSAKLEPVLIIQNDHVQHYEQFSTNIKINVIKLIPVLLARTFGLQWVLNL